MKKSEFLAMLRLKRLNKLLSKGKQKKLIL
jgi:hypothetical protein